MNQRLLSVVLTLCLYVPFQPAVYASQEFPSRQEDILTEESKDGTEIGMEIEDGKDTVRTEDTAQSEDEAAKGTESESENIGDENSASTEESSQKEDGFTEETKGEAESNDSENVTLPENAAQQEDDLIEETVDEPETGDDENIALPEDAVQQEDDFAQETVDGPEISGDEDTVLSEGDLPEQSVLEEDVIEEDVLAEEMTDEPAVYAVNNGIIPTQTEAYEAMIALKTQDGYKEGTPWTNDVPYSESKGYDWQGGLLDGKKISARGCVAFAFRLSDEAFGNLPARMYAAGKFKYEDIKVGDILRLNTDTHTVIVLQVENTGVVIAEGNDGTGDHKGKVHWGRTISKNVVIRDTSHYITRYPEGYVAPDDPEADDIIANGILDGGLNWNLTKAGTLTISGSGDMPDFGSAKEQPWGDSDSPIRRVIIEDGVTGIGSCAFWDCGVFSAEISSDVTIIGNSAFRGSSLISVTIPSKVKTIGDSAFRECENLSSVTFPKVLETIGQNAFRACTSLDSIELPASVREVGTGAFMECTEMKYAEFTPGSRQVRLGDNIFTRCYWLMNVTLPAKIDRIGEGMFQNCSKLAGLEIPQGAESIGGSAFASCSSFTTVIIPDSVSAIGIAAFSACLLEDIYFTGTEEQWKRISKLGDTASAVSKATIHYNHVPGKPDPGPDPDDGDDPGNDPGKNPSDDPGNDPGKNPSDDPGNDPGKNPSDDPGNDPGKNPGDDPGSNSGDNPGGNSDDNPNNNPGSNSGNTPGGNSGNTPGNSSGNASSGSSGDSSSDKSDTGDSQSQNTSSNTAGGQWVAENTGNANGTAWKLQKVDGTYVAGTKTTDADGNVKEQVAWAQVNGAWYAFGADGYADFGWIMDHAAGSWYYVGVDSGMQTGWHDDASDGATYFLDPVSGKMLTGWNLIEGKWYYFNELAGEPTWQRDEETGEWSFTGSENRPFGAMFKGEATPDGYMVDENGAWIG